MTRRRLPNKRPGFNIEIAADGVAAIATINAFPDGRPGEVFLETGKPGSTIDLIGRDAAVLTSLLLQHDVPAAEIAGSLARLEDGEPATILGRVADLAAMMEAAI